MAQSSYPFDGQTTSETQYSQFFRELQDSGVAADPTASDLRVSGDGSGMNVKVQPGRAILRGHAYASTAVETLIISAADASPRTDRVILRLDPAANSITLAVIKGTPGGGIPTLNQSDTGIFEIALANIAVGSSVTTILAGDVTRQRRFIGSRIGVWTTDLRPTSPRQGKLGYNIDSNSWEFWDGNTWRDLAPTVTWSTIDGKPTTFPPSTHTHPAPTWGTVTGKPTVFTPEPHTHAWEHLTNAPSTFTPATHNHHWDSIQGKPGSFPPAGHTHGYLEAGDTISWANGSKQPHSRGVSGSGTYYAVWVRGDGGFCRNTSSIKYKENVRDFEIAPEGVLALKPRIYDRKAEVNEAGEIEAGNTDEVGLIAEEVAEHLPWIVNYLDGQIDGLRYDLLGVALLPVVQGQAKQINALEDRLAALEGRLS
ncbi:tail fiber domain-containing protein [Streptomyces sp. NPDC051546]|uniref:tail fiber domain-containing protein n=1 Tax=Streptomyces sp. NPDC051546 TaxID=3365655 RepID=UPI0037B01AE9